MRIHWHEVSFVHSCGLKGTILEVCMSQDGEIAIGGVCVVCGEEFTTTESTAILIAKSAIKDYVQHCAESPQDMLALLQPVGRPC